MMGFQPVSHCLLAVVFSLDQFAPQFSYAAAGMFTGVYVIYRGTLGPPFCLKAAMITSSLTSMLMICPSCPAPPAFCQGFPPAGSCGNISMKPLLQSGSASLSLTIPIDHQERGCRRRCTALPASPAGSRSLCCS